LTALKTFTIYANANKVQLKAINVQTKHINQETNRYSYNALRCSDYEYKNSG